MAKTGSNIYKRKDGRYEGRILVGHNIYQKPQYIYVYARTLRVVKQKMQESKGKLTAVKGENLLLKTCADEWLSKNRELWKPTTYDTYCGLIYRYIIPILGDYKILEITQDVLEDFVKEIEKKFVKKKLSARYIKYICSRVRQIAMFAGEKYEFEIKSPKIPSLKGKREVIQLPGEEIMQKLEAYLVDHLDNDTCLGILLAMHTGIRIGELSALRWKDIDLQNGMVTICRNLQRVKNNAVIKEGQTKTIVCAQNPKSENSKRIIPIADNLSEILKKYQKAPGVYIISGKRKEWAEVRTIQYRFKAILKKCGINPFNFHLLRHSFATRCINQGGDIKSISEILGHGSVQVTINIYLHSSMELKKKMINRICHIAV